SLSPNQYHPATAVNTGARYVIDNACAMLVKLSDVTNSKKCSAATNPKSTYRRSRGKRPALFRVTSSPIPTVPAANTIRQNVISNGEIGAASRTSTALVEKNPTAKRASRTPNG